MKGYNLDNTEITDRVYDTLFKNKQWPQLNIEDMTEQYTDSRKGVIRFMYRNKSITIRIESIPFDYDKHYPID